LVLRLFYGLATEYTIPAVENFIQKLLVDQNIARHCKDWFYDFSAPHRFIELLFNIGFCGVQDGKTTIYKTGSGEPASMPALSAGSIICIHPAYHSALHLREILLPEISDEVILQVTGILEDLPQGVTFDDYYKQLKELSDTIDYIPLGIEGAADFENFVGGLIKLCFFRALTNVQPKVRNYQGVVIRDWIASNRAPTGFWQMIRDKYAATQIIWECKSHRLPTFRNSHQTSYYITDVAGRFVVMVYRGREHDSSYFKHIDRIAQKNGLVLLLTDKDVKIFIRQALNGKVKEDHINELFDRTVRALS
jgi:hypothetical protein